MSDLKKIIFTARVRSTREGNVLTRVCLSVHGGGYLYPIMLCNISQNAMGQPTLPGPAGGGTMLGGGGYPGWGLPWLGGTLLGGLPWLGGTLAGGRYPGGGGTLAGGVPCPGGGRYPGQGVPWLGGGTLVGGYPGRGVPS